MSDQQHHPVCLIEGIGKGEGGDHPKYFIDKIVTISLDMTD